MERLVVGLGNHGEQYKNTRHNIGFMVVEMLVNKRGGRFIKDRSLPGYVSCIENTCFLLPTTYMNHSGEAVSRAQKSHDVLLPYTLVVCDDVHLALGVFRFREQGGTGGHKGLRSIEEHLHTKEYPRLRVGVDEPPGDILLEDYVLGDFSIEDQNRLPQVIQQAVLIVSAWIQQDKKSMYDLITQVNDAKSNEAL